MSATGLLRPGVKLGLARSWRGLTASGAHSLLPNRALAADACAHGNPSPWSRLHLTGGGFPHTPAGGHLRAAPVLRPRARSREEA